MAKRFEKKFRAREYGLLFARCNTYIRTYDVANIVTYLHKTILFKNVLSGKYGLLFSHSNRTLRIISGFHGALLQSITFIS